MHTYATDSNERRLIPLLIAVIGILCAWFLHRTLQVLSINIPWWFDAPSVVGFYGLFYSIFNRYLWRLNILKKTGLIKVPDLNRIWKGFVSSSFDEHSTKHNATVTIFQNWSDIQILFETEHSKSHSLIGAIITEDSLGCVLSYEYVNEPKANAMATMHAHRGTARLILRGDILEGEYYTGRDRQNYGVLSFKKKDKG